MAFENLPKELTDVKQWVVRVDKKPCDLSGRSGGWQSPDFWLNFSDVIEATERDPKKFSGIGFIIARMQERGDHQLIGIDLDCCRDPRNGWVSPWALEIIKKLNSYTEISLTGTGFHIWIFGKLPDGMDSAESDGMDPKILPPDTWIFIRALKPSVKKCNSIEIYEDGPRHFAMSGKIVEEYSKNVEYRPECIPEILSLCKKQKEKDVLQDQGSFDDLPQWVADMAKASAGKRLPPLNILDVIDTRGWEQCGDQLRGPHPVLGSSTGHNVVIDPFEGLWAYMHNGINSGGDAWLWLACMCGAVKWEEAQAGALRDRAILEKTVAYAVTRQLVNAEDVIRKPEIRPVTIADSPGAIGLGPDGSIQAVTMTKEGARSMDWVSDCAVSIHIETVEDGKTEFTFKGTGAKDKRSICVNALAADMADNRKFRAIMENAIGARNQLGKLTFEMVKSITRNPVMRQRVTAPMWRGSIPLIPGVDLAQDVEFKLDGITPALVYDGDLDRARDVLDALMGLRKYTPLLITVVLGAPLIARWFPNDRFGLAIWGRTGSKKTSIAQLATACYGVGYLDEAALLKHGALGATPVGAMEAMILAGILPKIVDNVKATDPRDAQRYISFIQAIMEGTGKLQGKKEGGLKKQRAFRCMPIITGEIKVDEASTSARLLNLTWSKENDDIELSKIQAQADVLPAVGYHWLRYLAASPRDIREGFEGARAKKSTEFAAVGYVNPGRLASIYCLMKGIWALALEGPFASVFEKHSKKFNEVLEYAIMEQGEEVNAETEISRFLQAVKTLRFTRPDLFMIGDIRGSGDRIIGRESDKGLFLFPEETLAVLKQLGTFVQIPSISSITKALKEEGLLRPTKDRAMNVTTMEGLKVTGWWLRDGWELDVRDSGQDQILDRDCKTLCRGSSPENTGNSAKQANIYGDKEENFMPDITGTNGINGTDTTKDITNILTNTYLLSSISVEPDPEVVPESPDKLPDIDSKTKQRLWISISKILKKSPRVDQGKKGLTAKDAADLAGIPEATIADYFRSLGWKSTKIEASGLMVWWADEKTLHALDLVG